MDAKSLSTKTNESTLILPCQLLHENTRLYDKELVCTKYGQYFRAEAACKHCTVLVSSDITNAWH